MKVKLDKKSKALLIVIGVAIVLVIGMVVLLMLPKGGDSAQDGSEATLDEGAPITLSTDAKGVHQAVIGRDSSGKISNNSYGTLMEYIPAQISQIHVENTQGTFDVKSYTPEGKATEYTLVGYEDFDLQSGAPDAIANAAASLDFTMIAGEDNGGGEFGFDKPRSVVTVTYTDDTKAVITLGDDAPQGKGTYAKFGNGKDIYVVDTDTVKAFDYGVNDLISLIINNSADDAETAQAQEIDVTANGSSFVLKPYTGEKFSASYYMTEPMTRYANEMESSRIEGGIRGLYATKVVMVNPSGGQLSDLGLSDPYATLNASYSDGDVSLRASKPDGDGNVNLMIGDRAVVYQLSADKVPWVTTDYNKLVSEYVLYPKMTALTGMEFNGTEFTLRSRTSTTTDDQGSETTSTVTTVYRDGEEVQVENFSGFYDNVSLIELADAKEENPGGSAELRVVYTYEDGDSDTVEFYAAGDSKYVAVVNGKIMGHARKSDVTRALDSLSQAQ